MQKVDVVVGGQYGSEAKGHVTAQLVKSAVMDSLRLELKDLNLEIFNVRVAGPNAGHTVYDELGNKYAFRALPVGAVVADTVKLYIAPGSEVDLQVLLAEIGLAASHGWDVASRLYVSRQATVLEQEHKDQESVADLVGKVGSTGKGIGAARAARLMRKARTMGEYYSATNADGEPVEDRVPWTWAEPEDLYATDDHAHNKNQQVIIEGTQGYGLSLRASGHYPQVTSSDCRSVDFLAMAGIDPTRCSVEITNWVVARVYPIRVAGNSGPMKGETTWEELGLEPEKTTVTQKIRRVGEWDPELVAKAVQANGGHRAKLVITMLDQVIPELADVDTEGFTDGVPQDDPRASVLQKALDWVEANASREIVGAHVAAVTFGPTKILFTQHAFDRGDRGDQADLNGLEQALAGAVAEIFGGLGQNDAAKAQGDN